MSLEFSNTTKERIRTIEYVFLYITILIIAASILMPIYGYIWIIIAIMGLALLYAAT